MKNMKHVLGILVAVCVFTGVGLANETVTVPIWEYSPSYSTFFNIVNTGTGTAEVTVTLSSYGGGGSTTVTIPGGTACSVDTSESWYSGGYAYGSGVIKINALIAKG